MDNNVKPLYIERGEQPIGELKIIFQVVGPHDAVIVGASSALTNTCYVPFSTAIIRPSLGHMRRYSY